MPAALKPDALVALAVNDDETRLVAATATSVTAFHLDGSVAWETTGFQQVTGLATRGQQVLVADGKAAGVAVLSPTGERAPCLSSAAVPGGVQPGAIATRGDRLFVSDARGRRLLRRRLP